MAPLSRDTPPLWGLPRLASKRATHDVAGREAQFKKSAVFLFPALAKEKPQRRFILAALLRTSESSEDMGGAVQHALLST